MNNKLATILFCTALSLSLTGCGMSEQSLIKEVNSATTKEEYWAASEKIYDVKDGKNSEALKEAFTEKGFELLQNAETREDAQKIADEIDAIISTFDVPAYEVHEDTQAALVEWNEQQAPLDKTFYYYETFTKGLSSAEKYGTEVIDARHIQIVDENSLYLFPADPNSETFDKNSISDPDDYLFKITSYKMWPTGTIEMETEKDGMEMDIELSAGDTEEEDRLYLGIYEDNESLIDKQLPPGPYYFTSLERAKAADAKHHNKTDGMIQTYDHAAEPAIGMTKEEVQNGAWGYLESKNVTETQGGTHEQWVYPGGKYVYFDNGASCMM